jgi:hypothetical protein
MALPPTDERCLPSRAVEAMSYAMLLRSLPAIEAADLDAVTLGRVASRVGDGAAVAASGLRPLALWSCFRHGGVHLFLPELEAALQHSLANVPPLHGRSLILIDVSGSMHEPVRGHVGVQAFEIGAVFAAAVADATRRGGGSVDLVRSGTGAARQPLHATVARTVDDIGATIGALGHGTETWTTARRWFDGHDRVLILTDTPGSPDDAPGFVRRWACPLAVFDVRGGAPVADAAGRHSWFAGCTDASFDLVPRLDQRRGAA